MNGKWSIVWLLGVFVFCASLSEGADLASGKKLAQVSSGAGARRLQDAIVEERVFASVPVRIVRPANVSAETRLVVLFHGFGTPASPEALSHALPLTGLNAVLAYVNLPMVAGRLPAGGLEELRRVQRENFVNGFFFPIISGAATELRPIVREIAAAYHLNPNQGIGLLGFSAGGAAALLALVESDVPIAAAVIVNAPMSVEQNVENWEHALGRHFAWDDAARATARRYQIEQQADQIARREMLPALLLLQGEADESLGLEPVQRAFEKLKAAYLARGAGERVAFKSLPGLGHQFSPGNGAEKIDVIAQDWFQKFLPPPAGR